LEFEPTVKNIVVEIQREYDRDKEFKDVYLLCSLVMARDPNLKLETIRDRLNEHIDIESKIIESFGSIPSRTADGEVLTLKQFVISGVTRTDPPKATHEQVLLYEEYEKSLDKIKLITQTCAELESLHRRASIGDSVVIDPLLKNSFTDFLDKKSLKNNKFEKIDLYYLFIKELKTLPVGKSIKETIELANTREGDSLRKRVCELHDSIIAGELVGVDNIKKKIRDDIHEYKSLTRKLMSPNTLSDLTDLTLSSTSLIPAIGTVTGAMGLAKTTTNIAQKRKIYEKIQKNIWVDFRGSNI
jgi:hypothetical protein